MKDESIIRNKLWEAKLNNKEVAFPLEFYSQKDVLIGLNTFDLNNVPINIRFGKTDKGFDVLIIQFPEN